MNKEELLELFTTTGYTVLKNAIPLDLVERVDSNSHLLVPHRGHAMDHKYFPADKITECNDLAVWWSQELSDWPEVQEIIKHLVSLVGSLFDTPGCYIADIITNEPGNTHIKPHIDSPYRFDRWWDVDDLLGIQCIIPLCKFTEENGGTGLLPNSHNKRWVVKDSYAGVYNEEFLAGVIQPEMNMGDVLVYHPRTLHSTMPNKSNIPRRALLIHITSDEMVKQLRDLDTIWQEESKKK